MSELREALEGAFDEVENEASEEVSADLEQVGAALDGKDPIEHEAPEAEAEAEAEEAAAPKAEDEAPAEENGEPAIEQRADSDVKTEKPPVGWSPKNREHWATLPDELKVQINKREREVNQVLQQSSNARKLEQAFNKTVSPYQSAMIAQGADNPLQAIDGLLKTATTLGMGSPQQKAQRIAELIGHYGVDIQVLDGMLAGNAPAPQPTDINHQVNQAVNQAIQPFVQQQQAASQQQQQELQNTVSQKIQAIESKEFFNDVRLDMADIMEMATKRGQVVSLEAAYERAVAMNPEISQVINARQQQASLKNKQRAASSVNGNRGGMTSNSGNMSLHDTLSAAWDGNLT